MKSKAWGIFWLAIACLMFAGFCLALSGCANLPAITPEQQQVAENLISNLLDTATVKPPAVIVASNAAPVVVTPAAPTIKCTCNLTKPVSKPPYTDAGLAAAGNSMECPNTKAGAGVIRFAVPIGGGKHWLIGKWIDYEKNRDTAYDIDGKGNACGKCFPGDGGRYHFLGYTRNANVIEHPCSPGVWFPYSWVTFIGFEWRKD